MKRRILSGESADEMWGSKPRKAEETDIDVTPLVDCVFLLLSFFMLTSPMKGDPDRNVPAASHGVGVDPLATTAIRIVDAEPSPRILLDNRESTIDDIRPFVEAGVRKGHNLVVIKADRKVPCGLVQKVAKAATAVEGVQFSLGVQDKKSQATATQ
jgi:biopolymer transport protein ExbD